MTATAPTALDIAESWNTHMPLGPDDERIETPEYVVWLGSDARHPLFTVVQRLRLSEDRVAPAVAEIRALLAARGRSSSSWEIGPSTTPPDLGDRLLANGFAPYEEPLATGMILRGPLPAEDTAIVTRRAESVDHYVAAYVLLNRVFGERTETDDERRARAARDVERHRSGTGSLHLGFLDGELVASAASMFIGESVVLAGGATLPHARGKGAYRALVRARYDEAAGRGTPTLVVQAGAMSRPILEKLGFESVAVVRIFTPS